MTEDPLDYWARLLRPLFPDNSRIVTRYSGDDHIIEIDWNFESEPGRLTRRSRKIQITISDGAVDDYLDKGKKDREVFEISLKKMIQERYNLSNPGQQGVGSLSAPDKLMIVKDTFNA
jgi:hypothetical protein